MGISRVIVLLLIGVAAVHGASSGKGRATKAALVVNTTESSITEATATTAASLLKEDQVTVSSTILVAVTEATTADTDATTKHGHFIHKGTTKKAKAGHPASGGHFRSRSTTTKKADDHSGKHGFHVRHPSSKAGRPSATTLAPATTTALLAVTEVVGLVNGSEHAKDTVGIEHDRSRRQIVTGQFGGQQVSTLGGSTGSMGGFGTALGGLGGGMGMGGMGMGGLGMGGFGGGLGGGFGGGGMGGPVVVDTVSVQDTLVPGPGK